MMQALPEPKPNDNMLPVDLNRTSLYWGELRSIGSSILPQVQLIWVKGSQFCELAFVSHLK
eukprot:4349769-Amphidinium_carterae.1